MKTERAKVIVRGVVQGVGFRPFVYRLATKLKLSGWVLNAGQGVFIEVEGPRDRLQLFLLRLEKEKPPLAAIQSLEFSLLDAAGYDGFHIRYSEQSGRKTVMILPDLPSAQIVSATFLTQRIADTATRSRIAQTADHDSRSSKHCHTTVPTLR